MITLYEGIVMSDQPVVLPGDPNFGTVDVVLEEEQIIVKALINRTHGTQQVPLKNSKVLVYRTYNSQARIITLLDDQPNHSPIWQDNTPSTSYFQPGEVAMRASGDPTSSVPQDGGLVWCKNSGDVTLYSGSMTQKFTVSDSFQGIVSKTNRLVLATNNSSIATHAFTLSTDLTGLSSSQWGIQNPITGVFFNSISISPLGTINLGLSDPLLGTLLSGISFTTIPSITQPLAGISMIGPGEISLTAAQLTLRGLTSFEGDFSINGNTSIIGNTSISGATSITGNTSIAGNASVAGSLNVSGVYSSGGIPGLTGAFTVHPGSIITLVGGIVVSVI